MGTSFELFDGDDSRGVFHGPLPRPGDKITIMTDSSGYMVKVQSVEHYCDMASKTSTARVYAEQVS